MRASGPLELFCHRSGRSWTGCLSPLGQRLPSHSARDSDLEHRSAPRQEGWGCSLQGVGVLSAEQWPHTGGCRGSPESKAWSRWQRVPLGRGEGSRGSRVVGGKLPRC